MVVESGLLWVCLFVKARMMAQQLRLKQKPCCCSESGIYSVKAGSDSESKRKHSKSSGLLPLWVTSKYFQPCTDSSLLMVSWVATIRSKPEVVEGSCSTAEELQGWFCSPLLLQERRPAGARLEVERESQRVRPWEKQCVKSGSLGSTRWVCKPCPTAGVGEENLNTRRAKLGALHLLLCSMLSMRGLGGAEKGCRHQRSKW